MLAIRLRRIGKRQHATFRFIVSEKTRSPQSSVIEFLGFYNPHTNPASVKVNAERITHWLKNGAQPSATVHNLLVDAGVIQGPKVIVAHHKKLAEADASSVGKAADAVAAEHKSAA